MKRPASRRARCAAKGPRSRTRRSPNNSILINYLSSSFGSTWQSTGIAYSSNQPTSFPIFQTTDTPHIMQGDYRYVIGWAVRSPTAPGVVSAYGFRVRYQIP